MQAYLVTITTTDHRPFGDALAACLDLPDPTAAQAQLRAGSHTGLRRLLKRLRHPRLDRTFRLADGGGPPSGPAIAPVECMGGWLRHDLGAGPFLLYEKNSGKQRFEVMERGAGPRGTARERGRAGTLAEAVDLAGTLAPSTIAEILAQVRVYCDRDRERLARLAYLAEPGRRLWVLPRYTEDGFRGLGEPATALGLGINAAEALFGSGDDYCWLVRFRTDSGEERKLGPLALSTVEEAAQRWWVTDGHGNLVTGGHPDRERMEQLAVEHGGVAQQGLGGEASPREGNGTST